MAQEALWYVVHTYSGYEDKVKKNIEMTRKNRGIEEQIIEVRVPMQEVMEVKNGAKKLVKKKKFPGYVYIHMIMNEETWYIVRNTTGVTGFVGPESKPKPLEDYEVEAINSSGENIEITTDLVVGETIYVIEGVWKDTTGKIQSVNQSKQTVTINVELFGRQTPVEISFDEVERMD